MKVIRGNVRPKILLEKFTPNYNFTHHKLFESFYVYAISQFLLYQRKVYSKHTKIKEDNKTIQAHHATIIGPVSPLGGWRNRFHGRNYPGFLQISLTTPEVGWESV